MEFHYVTIWAKVCWCEVCWWGVWLCNCHSWWRSGVCLDFLLYFRNLSKIGNYFKNYSVIFLAISIPDLLTLGFKCLFLAVSQGWRYILLAVGFALLFLAPIVSTWVPFYYTSSMAIGVFAVVLIILYQVHVFFCHFIL